MEDEIIEMILGVDIKVKTNKEPERILRLANFVNAEKSTMEVSCSDYDYMNQNKIVITINCDSYSFEII